MTDLDALSTRVSEFDIVANCASSSDVSLTIAILKGLKSRFENGKGVGTLIHTSGAANFLDFNKEGKFDPNAKIWTVRGLCSSTFYTWLTYTVYVGLGGRRKANSSSTIPRQCRCPVRITCLLSSNIGENNHIQTAY